MNKPFFIRTSAGIISRDAVSFIRITQEGTIFVFLYGVNEDCCNPIALYDLEAEIFLKMFEPLFDVRGKHE